MQLCELTIFYFIGMLKNKTEYNKYLKIILKKIYVSRILNVERW
jgi:hypothetical protein